MYLVNKEWNVYLKNESQNNATHLVVRSGNPRTDCKGQVGSKQGHDEAQDGPAIQGVALLRNPDQHHKGGKQE